MELFRASGYSDYASRGYVIQARFRRLRGGRSDLDQASRDLDEAKRETRGIMALLEVDALVEAIQLALARGDLRAAARLRKSAAEGAESMRYGRAATKLASLQNQLKNA